MTSCPLHLQTVVVHVFPVKDQLPVEVPGTIRSLVVKETEVVYLTQNQLHFTDRENPEADLTFVITQPCFSPESPGYRMARVQDGSVRAGAEPQNFVFLCFMSD